MWRPENWENPWRSFEWGDGEIYQWTEAKIHEQYEAGADAMLEALRVGTTRINNIGDPPNSKGVIVFIPDEE